MSDWVNVDHVNNWQDGEHKIIDIDDTPVAIFKIGGEFYAIEDICSHDGTEIADGQLEGETIICPRHGARFCLKTGAVQSAPAYENITSFPVKITDEIVQVRDNRWD